MYLNTNYVQKQQQQQQQQSSGASIPNQPQVIHTLFVYDNGVEQFKNVVIYKNSFGNKIRNLIIGFVQKERNGESVDRLLLKKAVRMLCEMNCYNDVLEAPLLATSSQYFSDLARDLLNQTSVTDYLKLVDERLNDELLRVQYYLNQTTKSKIDSIVREEMVTKHLNTIMESPSGYLSLIRDDKISELQRMYNLFSANEKEHLSVMIKLYTKYIEDYGMAYVMDEQKIQGTAVAFIEGLLEQKRKYDKITNVSFYNNASFITAQNDGFASFADGIKQKRIPEFLSLYLDNVIQKCGTSSSIEYEVEQIFNESIALFRYFRDKDIFENYYKVHLSKRLLSKYQAELEQQYIIKLKTECGYSFTSKIEGMFKDMKLSAQSNDQFQQHEACKSRSDNISFYVNILTHSFWPAYTLTNAVLPNELNGCCESFTKFYNSVHSGRKLTWQKTLGDGILVARFPSGKHELVVSTYQMCILMLFNNQNEYTYANIREMTQIPDKELKKNLTYLCMGKTRILTKEPKTKNLEENHKFVFNSDFKSSSYRVKVAFTSTKETEEEVKETESQLETERKPVIEAAIVKLMKARKQLHHNQLVEEIVRLLSNRFTPNPQEIKRRIENLIEREFLSREKEDHKTYNYIA